MSITNTYKYSGGKIKYNFQAVNIVDITNQICHELSFLTENEVKIGKFFNIKTEIVKADGVHIRRVISNLISNAIKYKKEGTPITVELSVTENYCVFAVTNSGNYLKPELQKEIFQKYVSKANKFNSLGTGLGLYLSKKIICYI